MATITERKGGRFLVRVRRDGFKAVAKTFGRKQDAAAWARRVEADMESGRWRANETATPKLAQAIELYREGAGQKLKGHATYDYWLDELKASDIASKRVSDLAPFDLAQWRDGMQRAGLKPGTVVRKMGLVSGLLTWCQKERGWIAANPMRGVTKPRVNDARDRTLSDDERRYLLAAAAGRGTWLADALTVLLRSAMRRGELFGLQRADVDYAQATAHLRDTKNGSARDVPLCPQALDALRRLDTAASARGSGSLIPVGAPGAMTLAFRRAVARGKAQYAKDSAAAGRVKDAGFLADLRLHDCRHDAVTHWAETGGLSLVELMQVSGHKSMSMLRRYAHLSASKVAGKMAALSQGGTATATVTVTV